MLFGKRAIAALIACLFLTLAVSSQVWLYSQASKNVIDGKKDKTEKNPDNLVVNVELVNVLFTVMDRKEKLVTDLNKSDLKLYEDSKAQTITNFSRETDLPLTIALVIDTSTSIRDRFKFEQEAAIDFLYRTLRPKKDKAFLITFDSAIELVQDYTDNPETLSKAIRQIRPGGGRKSWIVITFPGRATLRLKRAGKYLISKSIVTITL